MSILKRMLAMLVCVMMLLSVVPVIGASAAGSLSVSCGSATTTAGSTVSVNLSLSGNPGFSALNIALKYDKTYLTLQNVTNQVSSLYMSTGTAIVWDGAGNYTGNGTLATATFKVADNAPAGSYTVQVIFMSAANEDFEEVPGSGGSGKITIKCTHPNKIVVNAKAPTCTATGNNKYYTCSCGAVLKADGVTETTVQKETLAAKGHDFNGGVVTKNPTCKETGIKTFTCIVCKATKTESVPKTTDHNYGSWTKVDDTNHKHSCTVCGKEETAKHTFDGGKVTQQPTCKAEGIRTFTCTACKATKTESVPKTTDHKYGSWTKVDDTNHKHSCTVCGKEETAKHTFNSGKVTVKPTCKEEGVKTFACTICGGTKTESIDKLDVHTYDHGCDTDCNICGLERTTSHQFKTTWSKNKTQHWHECSACKEKQDAEDHIPGPKATEEKAQTCTTCDYVIKPALGHTHSYGKSWVNDDNGHWYACSGCEEKGSYAAHRFDDTCDADCNDCEYTRVTAHDYQWAQDANGHWQFCLGCDNKIEESVHVPGPEATETTAQTCTICGYELVPALVNQETAPLETTEPSQQDDLAEEPSAEKTNDDEFPWWIVIVAAVLLTGGTVLLLLKKKRS